MILWKRLLAPFRSRLIPAVVVETTPHTFKSRDPAHPLKGDDAGSTSPQPDQSAVKVATFPTAAGATTSAALSADEAVSRPVDNTISGPSVLERFLAERADKEGGTPGDPKDDESDVGDMGLEMSMVPGLGDLGRSVLEESLRTKEINSVQASALRVKIEEMEEQGLQPKDIEEQTKQNVALAIRRQEALVAYYQAYPPVALPARQDEKEIEEDRSPSMEM